LKLGRPEHLLIHPASPPARGRGLKHEETMAAC